MAKRIASATNKKKTQTADDIENGESIEREENNEAGQSSRFKLGDFVRATYDADGIDYEAQILSVGDNDECLIKFIGYDNEQNVYLDNLMPSWGLAERKKQISEAEELASANEMNAEASESEFVYRPTTMGASVNNSRPMIPPPPPMPPMLNDLTEDSEHLSAMLMAWYMSGYYTGLYQGHKLAKHNANGSAKRKPK